MQYDVVSLNATGTLARTRIPYTITGAIKRPTSFLEAYSI